MNNQIAKFFKNLSPSITAYNNAFEECKKYFDKAVSNKLTSPTRIKFGFIVAVMMLCAMTFITSPVMYYCCLGGCIASFGIAIIDCINSIATYKRTKSRLGNSLIKARYCRINVEKQMQSFLYSAKQDILMNDNTSIQLCKVRLNELHQKKSRLEELARTEETNRSPKKVSKTGSKYDGELYSNELEILLYEELLKEYEKCANQTSSQTKYASMSKMNLDEKNQHLSNQSSNDIYL